MKEMPFNRKFPFLLEVAMQDKIRFFSPAEIVGVLQNTPTTLNALLQNLPNEAYAYHPGDGRWCAKEVVGHLISESLLPLI
jgi:hypothetical protein